MKISFLKQGICALAFAAVGFSCNDYGDYEFYDWNATVTDIYIDATSLTLEKRSSVGQVYWPIPANASLSKVVWTSANPDVAVVSSVGTVTGIAAGTTTLTASADGVSKTVSVTVTGNPNPTVPVPVPYAVWTFDDTENPASGGTATSTITLVGDVKSIGGPEAGDNAVRIAHGIANYIDVNHGIPFTAGKEYVEDWSMVLVFRYADMGQYKCLFQTWYPDGSGHGGSDGDLFINKSEAFGCGTYFGPALSNNKWYILVFSRQGSKAGGTMNSWINAIQYHNDFVNTDIKYSLPSHFAISLDEDGEDYPIDVAELRIYDKALTSEEAYAINFEYLKY
jgi:hypothetical protein